jgi:hypothetical protein
MTTDGHENNHRAFVDQKLCLWNTIHLSIFLLFCQCDFFFFFLNDKFMMFNFGVFFSN